MLRTQFLYRISVDQPPVQSGWMWPSTEKAGSCWGRPPEVRMLPAESRRKRLPRIVPYGSPLRASMLTPPNSPCPSTIVLTPGARSTTSLWLWAKLKVDVRNPARHLERRDGQQCLDSAITDLSRIDEFRGEAASG